MPAQKPERPNYSLHRGFAPNSAEGACGTGRKPSIQIRDSVPLNVAMYPKLQIILILASQPLVTLWIDQPSINKI
jgi:hypothetical protein